LTEVAAAIARNTGRADLAKEAVKNLTNPNTVRLVPLDAQLIQASIDIAADLQLRAAGAIYVAVAHQMNIPLISWDKEQLSRASSLIKTYTPNSY
jgi:predicted nucleic acid-binding protein